jgi:hypothetical protein
MGKSYASGVDEFVQSYTIKDAKYQSPGCFGHKVLFHEEFPNDGLIGMEVAYIHAIDYCGLGFLICSFIDHAGRMNCGHAI